MPEAERYYAFPPPCIPLSSTSWNGEVSQHPPRQKDVDRRYISRCNRPIYGSTDAPLRWYVALASRLRQFKYFPHRTDLCLFSRRDPQSLKILALVLVHVDDLVMCGSEPEIVSFVEMLDSFSTPRWSIYKKNSRSRTVD